VLNIACASFIYFGKHFLLELAGKQPIYYIIRATDLSSFPISNLLARKKGSKQAGADLFKPTYF